MKRALMLTVVASLAGTPALRAGAVSDWSLIAQNSIVVVGKKFPGEAAVYMGIVHAAIYDAAVGVSGGYRPYRVSCAAPARRFARCGRRYGGAPRAGRALPRPGRRSRHGLCREPDGHSGGPAQDRRDRRRREGRHRASSICRRSMVWRPRCPTSSPPPVLESTSPPRALPLLGTKLPRVVPLALETASQFRPDGPSPLGSDRYAADLRR